MRAISSILFSSLDKYRVPGTVIYVREREREEIKSQHTHHTR